MRPLRLVPVVVALVLWAGALRAQTLSSGPLLTDDLCGCMGTVDVAGDDRAFTFAVRHCLEEAVVRHPSEVLALLKRYPQQENKPYMLGLVLGGALESGCPRFHAVKARLQQLPGQGSLRRPGT